MGIPSAITPDESAALSDSAGRFLRKSLQSLIGASEAMIPLEGFPGPDEVHDIRVNMKRGRAILKLLRDSPGTDFYRRENMALRDISSLFSLSREADVLQKTLKTLAKRHPHVFTGHIIRLITLEATTLFNDQSVTSLNGIGRMTAGGGSDTSDQDGNPAIAATAREQLRRAWYRIGFANMSGVTRETLLDGLWSSFSRASAALSATQAAALPEDAHEFRKRSKDLLYQVRFFSDYNPGHFEKVYSQLDTICSVLGKCNDLAVAGNIVSNYNLKSGDKQMLQIMATMEEEKNEMLKKIMQPASNLFKTFYSGS
jgi:CHAD domain-containing protein